MSKVAFKRTAYGTPTNWIVHQDNAHAYRSHFTKQDLED